MYLEWLFLPDDTFLEYREYLRTNRDRIRELLFLSNDSPTRKIYEVPFRDNFFQYTGEEFGISDISATDSSIFVRELYNGKKIIISRAFTKYGGEVWPSSFTGIMWVDREDMGQFTVMMMEHLEHLSVLKFLRERRPFAALIDGSLTGRLFHRKATLLAEGYENFPEKYFLSLKNLIELSLDTEVPLIFIAKSSETSIFRRFLSERYSIDDDTHREVTDHLLVKSIANSRGYTNPVTRDYTIPTTDFTFKISTLHVLPDVRDIPLKVDLVQHADVKEIPPDIINMIFYGYAGYKVYNLWLADVDNAVKLRRSEIENIYMKEFERQIGVEFYETRGERRARTRI